jgi:CDP-diacylglycerol--glycerol-3-phosphate 3-phosphatidyltransferase
MAETEPVDNSTPTPSSDKEDTSEVALWTIPNQLTLARLAMSVVFFVILGMETHGTFPPESRSLVLVVATVLFVLAVLTDFLDGYLARRWKMVSTFGRIADPFADKIIICGGFIMLIGIAPRLVEPWFAMIIVVREFLVSGLRSFFESRGVAFGAVFIGKLKMVVQSIAIPVTLGFVALYPEGTKDSTVQTSFYWVVVASLAVTLVLTVASCADYIQRAIRLARSNR